MHHEIIIAPREVSNYPATARNHLFTNQSYHGLNKKQASVYMYCDFGSTCLHNLLSEVMKNTFFGSVAGVQGKFDDSLAVDKITSSFLF